MRSSALFMVLLVGCGGESNNAAGEQNDGAVADSSVGDTGTILDSIVVSDSPVPVDVTPDSGCTDLRCRRPTCSGGKTTSITGTVMMPNGTVPLYDATVFIPNGDVPPLAKGVQCDRCGTVPGDAIATAITDASGKFTLKEVPAGKDVPVVVQLGKWRRKAVIPLVAPCVDNAVDVEKVRLPKNTSEGEMPHIAVTVGGCDAIACILPKIGIDASEFGVDGDAKAVHFYAPSPPFPMGLAPGVKDARVLWNDAKKLGEYDLAIFACECTSGNDSKDATSFATVTEYLKNGGRILTMDSQYLWYTRSPDPLATAAVIPGGSPSATNPVDIVSTFPKGVAFATWLGGGSTVTFDFLYANISSIDASKVQLWGTSTSPTGTVKQPRVISIRTPVGTAPTEQCGRAMHLDAHVNQSDRVTPTFPAGCTAPVNQGQKAFEFLFFEAQSCIQDDSLAPVLPPSK